MSISWRKSFDALPFWLSPYFLKSQSVRIILMSTSIIIFFFYFLLQRRHYYKEIYFYLLIWANLSLKVLALITERLLSITRVFWAFAWLETFISRSYVTLQNLLLKKQCSSKAFPSKGLYDLISLSISFISFVRFVISNSLQCINILINLSLVLVL